MGRKIFSTVYTDVSEAAGWRRTMHQDGNCELPWKDEPAHAKLHYFTLSMLRIDYMHTFHLGVARDLVGSALKIIASGKNWFSGGNINARLKQITAAVKTFGRQKEHYISIKKLTKNSLGWAECPEFKGSAADTAVFLGWLATILMERPPPPPYDGLPGVVWVANHICEFLFDCGCFLTDEAWEQVRVLAKIFFTGYLQLAVHAHEGGKLLFKMRPKFHILQHLLEGHGGKRNPAYDATFMDEDHVRWCLKMFRKCSHRTASLNVLKRHLVTLKTQLRKYV